MMSALDGLAAVKSNRPEDQARLREPLPEDDTLEASDGDALARSADVVRLPAPGRPLSVRVHWGIVFAAVASLVLWFAIKSVVELVL
jgi:hypothetical protein